MATPPILTPTGTTGWNQQKWQRTIEYATYQKLKFIPTIDEGDRPLGQLNIRKHARVSGSVLAQNGEGTGLTYSNIIGTPVAAIPIGSYVAVAWSANEAAQLDVNLDAEGRSNIEAALAELTETNALANVPTLTNSISDTDVSGPMIRQAWGRLMGNTNGVATPGGDKTVYGIFSHTQYPNLGNIPEFNNAEIRGDSETPYVKGIWMRGGGLMLLMSTVIATDGNGWHNCLYMARAFVIAWNVRTQLLRQDVELQNRLIVFNNVATAVKNDNCAIDVRTTASAL